MCPFPLLGIMPFCCCSLYPLWAHNSGDPPPLPPHCHLACAIGRCLGCIGEPCHCCNVSSSLGSSPVRLACDPPPILSPIHLLKTISPQCVVLEDSSFSASSSSFSSRNQECPKYTRNLNKRRDWGHSRRYFDEMVFPLCLSKESFP